MNNLEPESDELLKSQQNLFEKIQHNNRLFRIHFNLLVIFLITSVLATILLIYSLFTSLPTPLSPYSIIQMILLIVMIIIIGFQIRFHSSFLVKANRSLRNIERAPSALYYGLTSYVNTLSSVFNPSDIKKPLSQLLTYYLFSHLYLGFFTLFLFSNVADLANTDFPLEPVLAILYFIMLAIWFCIFISLMKIKKNVQKWEDKFTKLETWAQDLEEDTSEGAAFRGEDDE
ncbi:MAG: hypothetical protein HWN66_16580 [Candidatus Helarchaeota archaeon]|nr:hypothetical protein [Candidatus Helarchaeota archaeon]